MNKNKNVICFLYRATCIIMIFLFALTFVLTLGTLSHMPVISAALDGFWKPLFLLSGSILLFLLINKLSKLLLGLSEKKQNRILIIMGCIGIAMQLAFLLVLRPCLQYDALKPVDTAISLLKGIPLPLSDSFEYFSIYPHNLPLTLYIMCIFKIAGLLGIAETDYILVLQLINIVFLDFSLVRLYRLLKRKAGAKVSVLFALLCFVNPLLYYYPIFFYTQVLSIPLFVLLITVFFQVLDADTIKKRAFFGICFGVTVFFAWKIRFFTLITLIALAMYLLFFQKTVKTSKKAASVTLLSILLSFSCCLTVHSLLMDKYSLSTEKEHAFPVQHWLMMGLQGDGTFYYVDEDFSKAFLTRQTRTEAETEVIINRLNDLRLNGLIRLWGRKLSITWADGYDDYPSNLVLVKQYSDFNDWISGYRSEFLAAWLHIYNSMSWLLLTICALQLFRKKAPDFIYAICITIVGGMVFHLFWEAGEQYSMPFALLMIAGASMGADSLSHLSEMHIRGNIKASLSAFIFSFIFMVTALVHGMPGIAGQESDVVQISAVQNLVAGEAICLHKDQVLTQTVTCSRPMNTLSLRYKYYGEHKEEALIRLRLLDHSGNIITTEHLPLENFFQIFDFTFPKTTADKGESFLIEICGVHIPDGEYVGFAAYNTGNWDTYPAGTAFLDNIPLPVSDIYFEFSKHSQKTLF